MSRFANIGRRGADEELEDSAEFGSILENILDNKSKAPAIGTKGKYAKSSTLSDSFGDSSDSFPSPKGKSQGAASTLLKQSASAAAAGSGGAGAGLGFDDSGEFDVDIDDSPAVRKSGKSGAAASKFPPKKVERPATASVSKGASDSTDLSDKLFGSSLTRPATTGGIASSSGSSSNSSSSGGGGGTFLTGGADKDDEGDMSFIPSIMQGRQPRQRRQLNVTTTATPSRAAGAASSLDELDRVLGIGAGGKTEGAGAGMGGAARLSLQADSDSDDDRGGNAYASSSAGNASARGDDRDSRDAGRFDTKDRESRDSRESIPVDPSPQRRGPGATTSPAWLPAAAPEAATGARSPQHAERERIRQLQQQADSSQLEKEAMERQYRIEIDTLKGKLSRADQAQAFGAISSEHIRDLGEGSVRQQREVSDLRRTNAQLDAEISRLKDETTLASLRHHEELKVHHPTPHFFPLHFSDWFYARPHSHKYNT